MKQAFSVFSLILLMSCGSDDLSNIRAYTEGKLTSKTHIVSDIELALKSEDRIISQGNPDANGNFTLSGPLFSQGFSLVSNQKILRFTASNSQVQLAPDSLSIVVPKGVTYVKFEEILVQ